MEEEKNSEDNRIIEKFQDQSQVQTKTVEEIISNQGKLKYDGTSNKLCTRDDNKFKAFVLKNNQALSLLKKLKKNTKTTKRHIPKSIIITVNDTTRLYISSYNLHKIKTLMNNQIIHFTYGALPFSIFNLITKPQCLINKNHNPFVLHVNQSNVFFNNLKAPSMNSSYQILDNIPLIKNPISYPIAMNGNIDMTKKIPKCLQKKPLIENESKEDNDFQLIKPTLNKLNPYSIEDQYPHSLDSIKLPEKVIFKFLNHPDDPIPTNLILSKIQTYEDNDYFKLKVIKLPQMPIATKKQFSYTPQSFPNTEIPLLFKSQQQQVPQSLFHTPQIDYIDPLIFTFLINFNFEQSYLGKTFTLFSMICQMLTSKYIISENDSNQLQSTLTNMYKQLFSYTIELKHNLNNSNSNHYNDLLKNLIEYYFKHIDSILFYYIQLNEHFDNYKENKMNEYVKEIKEYQSNYEKLKKEYDIVQSNYKKVSIKNDVEMRNNKALDKTIIIRTKQLDDIKTIVALFEKETNILNELIIKKQKNKESNRISNLNITNSYKKNMSMVTDKSFNKSRNLGICLNSPNVSQQLDVSLRNLKKENHSLKTNLTRLECNTNISFAYKQHDIFRSSSYSLASSCPVLHLNKKGMMIIPIILFIILFVQFLLFFYLKKITI